MFFRQAAEVAAASVHSSWSVKGTGTGLLSLSPGFRRIVQSGGIYAKTHEFSAE